MFELLSHQQFEQFLKKKKKKKSIFKICFLWNQPDKQTNKLLGSLLSFEKNKNKKPIYILHLKKKKKKRKKLIKPCSLAAMTWIKSHAQSLRASTLPKNTRTVVQLRSIISFLFQLSPAPMDSAPNAPQLPYLSLSL